MGNRRTFDISVNVPEQDGSNSKYFDNGSCLKRIGTVWTTSAHIITAMIGSGVLSLAWAMAQLGWVAGPSAMFLFSIVTYYTSTLLTACYRSGDPDAGKRNYTYMDAVKANLGGFQVKLCGATLCLTLSGVAIGYTIESSMSMMAIERSNCFHSKRDDSPCRVSSNPYMIAFGVVEIVLSQIPDFDQIWWLSIVAAVMSFTYSTIGLGLAIAKDTIKSPPSEYKTMKKATLLSVAVTTIVYMSCGCFSYAAFGDMSPRNLLTGFGFYNPYWLLDIANVAIVMHLAGAYQVFCQPLFAYIEKTAVEWFPDNKFIAKEIAIVVPGFRPFKLNLFKLVWRTIFVIVTTIISMLMPFFNDVVGSLGAFGFWPLTVYFPVEMYIKRKRIPKWSRRWVCLRILSVACLVISIAAAAGSFAGVVSALKVYKPFKTSY
ncbi:UNVERIFIED_CONTAM: Amino acid permease 3 [Sesamum radiatum]|uniref:Amino acid permease 3 n=1 Tax=Sesamum radiatum TaxID=300843 RepID=A0AAW2NAB4_SESRA